MRTEGKPTDTELDVSKGIVAGFVTEYADALEVAPRGVLPAIESAGVTPMVDTAKQNPGANKERDRPTAPDLRCLAMNRRDFARVLAEVQ